MAQVVYTGTDGKVYLERICLGGQEQAQKLAKELNEANNTNIYFVEEEDNDFYRDLIG